MQQPMQSFAPARVRIPTAPGLYGPAPPGPPAAPEGPKWWEKYLLQPALTVGVGAAVGGIREAMPTQRAQRDMYRSQSALNKAFMPSQGSGQDPATMSKLRALARQGEPQWR